MDKKTQEHIDLIDETIQLEEQEEFKEDSEEYRQSQGRIFDFEEIKKILERMQPPEVPTIVSDDNDYEN